MQIASAACTGERQSARTDDRQDPGGVGGVEEAMLRLLRGPKTILREAPALAIGRVLLADGASIRIRSGGSYRSLPAVAELLAETPTMQPKELMSLVIMTEWNVFRLHELLKT